MPMFQYKVVSANGETLDGELEARNQEAAISRLQELGHLPIQVNEIKSDQVRKKSISFFDKNKISQNDISIITTELSTLLNAGLPLDRAFTILIELTEEEKIVNFLSKIQEEVRGGNSLADAMEAQDMFSRFYLNMIRAGEAGGALESVLERLADFMERAKELHEQVKSALIYPMILLVVSGLSIILLLTFVVPQFATLFEDSEKALPVATQIVMGMGGFFSNYWWVMVGFVVLSVWWMRNQLSHPVSRLKWDLRFLRMPLIGDLVGKVEMARFSRTLGTLLGNGVALLTALSIIKETLGNRVLANSIGDVADSLKEGQSLAEPLLENKDFPRLAVHMIRVGEETGKLEDMLMKVADIYDKEVKITVARLLALLEPLMIVGLGITIAGIIMSILVAIMSVNELAA